MVIVKVNAPLLMMLSGVRSVAFHTSQRSPHERYITPLTLTSTLTTSYFLLHIRFTQVIKEACTSKMRTIRIQLSLRSVRVGLH